MQQQHQQQQQQQQQAAWYKETLDLAKGTKDANRVHPLPASHRLLCRTAPSQYVRPHVWYLVMSTCNAAGTLPKRTRIEVGGDTAFILL